MNDPAPRISGIHDWSLALVLKRCEATLGGVPIGVAVPWLVSVANRLEVIHRAPHGAGAHGAVGLEAVRIERDGTARLSEPGAAGGNPAADVRALGGLIRRLVSGEASQDRVVAHLQELADLTATDEVSIEEARVRLLLCARALPEGPPVEHWIGEVLLPALGEAPARAPAVTVLLDEAGMRELGSPSKGRRKRRRRKRRTAPDGARRPKPPPWKARLGWGVSGWLLGVVCGGLGCWLLV